MKQRKKTIRSLIFILLICIMLIPAIAIGSTYQIRSKKILMDNAELMMSQTLDETTVKVQEYLKNLSQPIDMLSHQTIIKDYVDSYGTEQNEQIAENLKYEMDIVHQTLDGTINVYLGTPNKEILISTNNGNGSYEMSVMNSDVSAQGWYKDSIDRKPMNGIKALFQEPYIDDVTQKTVVTLTQEVVIDGKFYGVLGLDIEFDSFEKYVQEIQLMESGYILITNNDGDIISDHQRSMITNEAEMGENDTIGSTKAETKKVVPTDVFGQFSEDKVVSYKVKKEHQFTKMVNEPLTGWKIIGVINEGEIQKEMNALGRIFVITTIIALITAIVSSIALTTVIVRYLSKMTKSFHMIGSGDLTVRLPAKMNNELGELEDNFNLMIEEVGKLVGDVSKQTKVIV